MALPKSFSASALKVAQGCLARYHAEHTLRGANFQGTAAGLGTTLHAALENFIRGFKIRRDWGWTIEKLLELYDEAFRDLFGQDFKVPEYKDGRQILVNWFHRQSTFDSLIPAKVLSLESKSSFPLKVMWQGAWTPVPFNYILDRLDMVGPGEYRVVDYKSNRWALTSEELRMNIQARAYAVAVATMYKDAQKIWVTFDFLRHESVGVVFTRDDNVDTYRMLQRAAQEVVDLDPNQKIPERLNPECTWCIRKATCDTLKSNIAAGGIMSLSLDDQVALYYEVAGQLSGITALKNDLEKQLILQAAQLGETDFETDKAVVRVTSGMRRSVDNAAVAKIVGSGVMAQYNGIIRVSDIDSLLNHPDLTGGQKAAIKAAITRAPGKPSVKVTKK